MMAKRHSSSQSQDGEAEHETIPREMLECDEVDLYWYPDGFIYWHMSIGVRGREYSFNKKGVWTRIVLESPREQFRSGPWDLFQNESRRFISAPGELYQIGPVGQFRRAFGEQFQRGTGSGLGRGGGIGLGVGRGYGSGIGVGHGRGYGSGLVNSRPVSGRLDGSGIGLGKFQGSGLGIGSGQGEGSGIPFRGSMTAKDAGPTHITSLGTTEKSYREIFDFVVNLADGEFRKETYNVLSHNCRHFADKLAYHICGVHVLYDQRNCCVM